MLSLLAPVLRLPVLLRLPAAAAVLLCCCLPPPCLWVLCACPLCPLRCPCSLYRLSCRYALCVWVTTKPWLGESEEGNCCKWKVRGTLVC